MEEATPNMSTLENVAGPSGVAGSVAAAGSMYRTPASSRPSSSAETASASIEAQQLAAKARHARRLARMEEERQERERAVAELEIQAELAAIKAASYRSDKVPAKPRRSSKRSKKRRIRIRTPSTSSDTTGSRSRSSSRSSSSSAHRGKRKKRMLIDLYYDDGSPQCHMVELVAAALDIQFNMIRVDIIGGDHLKQYFLQINPLHTVPTIVDGDFTLWESRAISKYLVNQYAKGSALYPEDPKARAVIDQILDFDVGVLFPRFENYYYPPAFSGNKFDQALQGKVHEALQLLNRFLKDRTYAAGPGLTIADLGLVASVSTIEAGEIKLGRYRNIIKWYKLVQSTAKNYNEIMDEGIRIIS